uniref:Putative spindle pole body protein n=1 Tax=Culex tarsalis TaxID=7177 RepID=A0A1Q3FVB3_CULTA
MADQPKPPQEEPRTRSRSKTPGLLNLRVSAERDLNGSGPEKAKAKKAPTVTTIQEESSPQKSASVKKTRTVTSDYSSDNTSPEVVVSIKKLSTDAVTEKATKVITTSMTITTSSTSSSAKESSSPKSTPAVKEVRQNETNKVLEATQTAILRTSTPKASSKSHKKNTLTPEELKQHVAYKEYKEAGEYWNKFPKTDYTYSELSPHRRELAPGMIAMPNMSRPGLSKHAERVSVMIQRNPTQESFIRQRYASSGLAGGSFAHSDPYDSGEEQLDLSQLSASRSYRNTSYQRKTVREEEHRSIVSRFFLSIVNLFYGSAHSVSRLFNKSEHNMYYTRVEDERGFFGKLSSLFNALLTSIFKKLYLLISTVLFLDTWLLQTSASDVTQGRRKRKFLLWLLVLLPFLLFGAFLLADEDQTIVLPASKRASIALSSLGAVLPASLNPSDLDAFRANLFQKLDWRESSLSWSALLPPSLDLGGAWSFWAGSKGQGGQYENLKSGLQRALSAEEYDELMRHIDAYIEGLLTEKYRKKEEEEEAMKVKREVAPEVVVHVASVVREGLKTYSYELTQGDVDRVAEQVRVSLVGAYPEVFDPSVKPEVRDKRDAVGITEENVVEIQRLIKQQISVTNNNFVISDQQLEELLMKILSSAKLTELVDSRILQRTKDVRSQQESQSALVENLKNEINEIKQHFTEKLATSSLMLEDNINVLKRNQDKLAEQVSGFRIENDEKYVKLLADIDARLAAVQREQFTGLNTIIKKNIVTILGMNVEQDFTDEDLKTWISNLFVAKDYLENRLKEYQAGVNAVIQQEMERSAATLMKEVSDRIQQEVLVSIKSHNTAANAAPASGGLTEDTVRRIVRDALRIYDADKTGLVDYALESAGGQILSTRCTENYQSHSAQISIFGIPLWYPTNTPRTVISPTMQPGQCWAFSGFPGYLVIQLNSAVVVTGFSLEHISKLLAPNGQIDSAPKNFSVWGLATEHDPDPVQLGSYVYQDNSAALQYFPVDDPARPELAGRAFRIVELRIESNHGNAHYTCLYRFRVHGERV